MPGILEIVEQKLLELRLVNVAEMQSNLDRTRLELRTIESYSSEGLTAVDRQKIKTDKVKKISECNKLEFNISRVQSYVPMMDMLLHKHKKDLKVDKLIELLHIGVYGSTEDRFNLSELDGCLSTLRETYPRDGDILIREISQTMRQHDKVWGSILRRIDSSTELLSEASKMALLPIIKQNFGQVIDYFFEDKTEEEGKYFGGKAIFTYQPPDKTKPPQKIKFFVKGHQNFEMESNKRTNSTRDPKAPDMKEILVYKILEHIGFGPKMHYFINPTARHGLFVATQDSQFTKFPETKRKNFSTAAEVQESKQPASFADEVELTALDIITRSLVLKDLHMKNYGRVDVAPLEGGAGEEKHKWKLFDFFVLNSFQAEEYNVCRDIGENFVTIRNHPDPRFTSGSGLAGSILRSENLAAHRPEVANAALAILEGQRRGEGNPEMSFDAAVKASYDEVTGFIRQEGEALGIDVGEALSDLDMYCQAITENYNALRDRIPLMGQKPSTAIRLSASEEQESVRE